MISDRPLTIDWDGEQARDLLYVSDAAAANLAALDAGSGEAYNIGTGVAVSVNEIFERLREITGYKRPPLRGPRREGDVRRIAIDCAKAERDLGWKAEVPLETGLELTDLEAPALFECVAALGSDELVRRVYDAFAAPLPDAPTRIPPTYATLQGRATAPAFGAMCLRLDKLEGKGTTGRTRKTASSKRATAPPKQST